MWKEKVNKNRDLISSLLESDLPIDEIYALVRRLAKQNEDIIKNKL